MQIGDVKGQKVYGPNLLTDQGFESWYYYPSFWNAPNVEYGQSSVADVPVRVTDSETGSYAIRFNSNGGPSLLSYTKDQLTPGASYTFTGSVKRTGSGTLLLGYNDTTTGYWWNFTGASAGTFTAGSGGYPTSDQTATFTPGSSYATVTSPSPQVVITANANVAIYLYSMSNDVYLDNVAFKLNGTGDSVLYNNNFEQWTLIDSPSPIRNFLSNWQGLKVNYTGNNTGPDTPTILAEVTAPQEGIYDTKITTFSAENLTYSLSPITAATVVSGSTYRLSVFGKYATSGNGSIILLNDLEPSATKIYNWTALTWDNYTPGSGGYINSPTSDNRSTLTLTSAWKLFNSPEFLAPASNKLVPCFVGVETDNLICYYDNASLQKVTTPSVARLFSWTNASTGSDLGASDIVEELLTTSGTPKNMRSLSGTGVYTTDFSTFKFAGTVESSTGGFKFPDGSTQTVAAVTTASGVYTPTRSAEVNMDGNVTMSEAQYMRVGNTVTVSGQFTADPTTTTSTTSFEMTLPVASNIGAIEDVSGTAVCGNILSMSGAVQGVAANDTAKIFWKATDVTSQVWSYIFTYQLL